MYVSDRIVRGEPTGDYENPNWGPLLELAPEHIDDFMWMCEIQLESGLRLHNYKHWHTRKNLHLDTEGRAFVFIWPERIGDDEPGSYRQVDPRCILREVLRRRGE